MDEFKAFLHIEIHEVEKIRNASSPLGKGGGKDADARFAACVLFELANESVSAVDRVYG